MGKQRIQELLNQLKDNHERDITASAAIFSVAQVAVNQLGETVDSTRSRQLPAVPPLSLTKDDLIKRYQNYAGCRKAEILTFCRQFKRHSKN